MKRPKLSTPPLAKKESEVSQLCQTLCNPVDCSPPGSSIHGILQARILEWVAISFSRGSSNPGIKPTSSVSLLHPQPPVNSNNRRIVIIKNYHLLSVNQIPRIVL